MSLRSIFSDFKHPSRDTQESSSPGGDSPWRPLGGGGGGGDDPGPPDDEEDWTEDEEGHPVPRRSQHGPRRQCQTCCGRYHQRGHRSCRPAAAPRGRYTASYAKRTPTIIRTVTYNQMIPGVTCVEEQPIGTPENAQFSWQKKGTEN